MTGYSTYWRTTIFASIVFHFLTALGFSYVLPHLMPEPTIADVAEFEWIDVDLSDNVVVDETEAIPTETVQETLPTFNANDLFIPELKIPEPVFVEEIPPTPPPQPKIPERPKPKNQPVVKNEQPAQPKVDEPPKNDVVETDDNQREVIQPPVTIKEVYPEKGSGLDFKGFVSIAATIDTDGKVIDTEILQSSGRYFVDEIAIKAAVQWTFKPALDQNNRPIQCIKIIVFNFKKISDA